MTTRIANLLTDLPDALAAEQILELLATPNVRIERIVSTGQASPRGFWYDQDWSEWVVVLAGSAMVHFDGEAAARLMRPGDFVAIAAHARHRVEWTDPAVPTVWLAIHHRER
jgi:cupin 2 domain-containing protein